MCEMASNKQHQNSAEDIRRYWNAHTVLEHEITSKVQSRQLIKERNHSDYPLCAEMMGYYTDHTGESILDFGCGPGHDTIGFALNSNPKKIISIDVSQKALMYLKSRLNFENLRDDLVQVHLRENDFESIQLGDNTIDFINCAGVLHHTHDPQFFLKEFYRMLKPKGRAKIMVYNYDSIWLHYFVAYERMARQNHFPGLNVRQAFELTTDGPNCPRALCFKPEEFIGLANGVGFKCQFLGGYPGQYDLKFCPDFSSALNAENLAEEHKEFLSSVTFDARGLPFIHGFSAGVGGVYDLEKV